MSKRLQVLFPEEEYKILKKQAKLSKQSLGGWVRQALRQIIESQSSKSVEEKLGYLKSILHYEGPIGSIDEIEKEIEEGYLK